MKKILYLMRHGQTLFNARKKVQGWCDAPLTNLGIRQAIIAGEYFKNNNIAFDHVYSSTSERACDTLEYVTNMPYTRVKGLKEWNFGTFEGESEDLNPPLPYGDFFVQFGGESEIELRNRIAKTLISIMKNHDHNKVLAVSHGAACRQFIRYWSHTSDVDQKERLGYCCILKFEFENDKFKLIEIINHDFSELS
ncbi:histidine phosphatase family protein [Clostridium botulinum]|uniref:histidine phosphatase family protein n=1 Tax=Clostridium botulinum TaxID=1491 RepID=UPI0007730A3E|nr:histidine phosphatase family protein [Clostridium botulinum]MBY6930443.1 histidine phosphatase family protein [Clostridium botulinum]NFG19405.1 histidine phosphatase family protein [Clostridium botulinum]NFO79490.1 histidine phosphatase family protein [Clostridium botulinum]